MTTGTTSKHVFTMFSKLQSELSDVHIILPSYQHAILGSRRLEKPHSHRGGILADDMGLGKTLTMISAIAMSLDEACDFAGLQHDVQAGSDHPSLRRASATLVIAPSSGTRSAAQTH